MRLNLREFKPEICSSLIILSPSFAESNPRSSLVTLTIELQMKRYRRLTPHLSYQSSNSQNLALLVALSSLGRFGCFKRGIDH